MYFAGTECEIIKGNYQNGRTCLRLFSPNEGPMAVATVNMPGINLEDDEVIIKDYAENEGMLDLLLQEGIVTEIVGIAESGYVKCPICKLNAQKVEKMPKI